MDQVDEIMLKIYAETMHEQPRKSVRMAVAVLLYTIFFTDQTLLEKS